MYLTWGGLNRDLGTLDSKENLREILLEVYPGFSKGRLANNTGQIWAFSHRMQPGDWVIRPSEHQPAIHIGEITGPYVFDADAENHFYHHRTVKWIEQDIPRSNFGEDLLYSFGSFMTICQIERNDAEQRVRAIVGMEERAR